jgi:hypothetical protein
MWKDGRLTFAGGGGTFLGFAKATKVGLLVGLPDDYDKPGSFGTMF